MPMLLMTSRSGEDAATHRILPTLLHSRPALALHGDRPSDPAGLLAEVMDVLGDGVILTDAKARVLYMNRSAEKLVSRRLLAVRSGLICADASTDTQTLQTLIGQCVRGREHSAHLKMSGRLFVTVAAVENAEAQGPDRAAVILIRDVDALQGPSPGSIAAWFGLTPAEAKLAREITRGDGLARCARRLGTRVTTVRSHLKHIFEKTDTKRQAHLVRLLLSCSSPLADTPAPGHDQTAARLGPAHLSARR